MIIKVICSYMVINGVKMMNLFLFLIMFFRDAAFTVCTYQMGVLDCLKSVKKAIDCHHFTYQTFDVEGDL